MPLHIRQVHRCHTGRDDGMVVGHFGRVEHLLRLWQLFPFQWFGKRLISTYAFQNDGAFGIHIIAEILGIYTRIGGEFSLVQPLYDVQCLFGAHIEFPVAIHLQRGQVVEMWWCFSAIFLLHRSHHKRFACDGIQKLLSLFLHRELAFGGSKHGVTIGGGKHPICFRHKMVYLVLSVHNERQRGGLHPAYAEHLPVLSVFEGIEPGGIHAENPVADGTAESGEIEGLILLLVLQLTESLADGLIGHRRNPESLHGTFGLRFLHHPSLDEFSLLSGVTAVDNAVGSLHQSLDDGKLLGHSLVVDEFDAEALRNHRQCREAPVFP